MNPGYPTRDGAAVNALRLTCDDGYSEADQWPVNPCGGVQR